MARVAQGAPVARAADRVEAVPGSPVLRWVVRVAQEPPVAAPVVQGAADSLGAAARRAVVAMRPVPSVDRAGAHHVAESPSAPSVRNSTTCRLRPSVACGFRAGTARWCDCPAVRV